MAAFITANRQDGDAAEPVQKERAGDVPAPVDRNAAGG
jgi:hypothetical protein